MRGAFTVSAVTGAVVTGVISSSRKRKRLNKHLRCIQSNFEHQILIKDGCVLDQMAEIDTVVSDCRT